MPPPLQDNCKAAQLPGFQEMSWERSPAWIEWGNQGSVSFLPIAVFLTSVTGGLRALQQEKAKLAFTFPGLKGEKEDVRLKKEKGGGEYTRRKKSYVICFATEFLRWVCYIWCPKFCRICIPPPGVGGVRYAEMGVTYHMIKMNILSGAKGQRQSRCSVSPQIVC